MASSAVIYASNADSREIVVLRLDRDAGSIDVVQRVDTDGAVMPMALSPGRRLLYAAIRSEPFNVQGFSIDTSTGELSPIGSAPLPESMAYISTDRSGCWLFAASYGGHLVSVSPIGKDGNVGEASSVISTGKNAHAAVVDPSNRHLFVTNLGSDQVLRFAFDASTGDLSPAEVAYTTRSSAGPRHIVFHPGGSFVYLLNELDGSVEALAFDVADGSLTAVGSWSTMPAGTEVKPWAADLHVTPDGRFLYTSERNTNTLAIWAVDPATGALSLVGHQATEEQPRGFQIDSTGTWLLAVGQASHHLSAYRIDPATGRLAAAARIAVGKNPNWVEIVDLP